MTDLPTHAHAVDALLSSGAVRFTPEAPVTFKSGLRAPVYVDNRALPFHPQAWHTVVGALSVHVQQCAFDVLAGVETAGIPHSAALAYTLGVPSVFVRKQAKGHGLGRRVEGGTVEGLSVLLLEDMITTGGSSRDAVLALRAEGAIVTDVVAIVSYGLPDAQAAFDDVGVTLHVLAPFAQVLAAARAHDITTPDALAAAEAWHADPWAWTRAHPPQVG